MLSLTDHTEAWNVDEDRAPYDLFEYNATEGSWISIDLSPDGRTMVFDLLGHIYEMPIGGGEASPLTEGRSWNNFPRYSPDGKKLLFTSDRGGSEDLWVMDLETKNLVNVSSMDLPVFQGDWSIDGRHIYGTALNMNVRFPAYQFNFYGDKQELLPAGGREPVNYFTAHPTKNLLYYEWNKSGNFYTSGGPRIMTYDLDNGKTSELIQRPGGAASPRISPDGRLLSYLHKDDQEVFLIIHDLETAEERFLIKGLDWGKFENRGFYGCYSNYAWHPDGREIYISFGGKIQAVDVASGEVRTIPFTAPVKRKIDHTHRVKLSIPSDGIARTRSHRWSQPVAGGILFEALGDLHFSDENGIHSLINTEAHETNPVYHEGSGKVYFARWADDSLGRLMALNPDNPTEEEIVFDKPSQYGQSAVSPDGQSIACIRGGGGLMSGKKLEDQTDFEIAITNGDGGERTLADITWISNRYANRPPTLRWSPDGEYLYFTEYDGDALTLKRIRPDGFGEQALYAFTNATRAVISPDLKWIAYREYHRSFITPYEFNGRLITVSAADEKGFSKRVDEDQDGDFMEWSEDGERLYWTRGPFYMEKTVDQILSGDETIQGIDLSIDFEERIPEGVVALTNARIITMNPEDAILEQATLIIERNRIKIIGNEMDVPEDAVIYDLEGHTIYPGMFDAHGHYGSQISALNVIEQRLYGLHANLAYGVTTMYDVYGTTQKDFWVDDMLRSGRITGPRIFSVGDPVFVTKYRKKMHRPITSLNDAIEIASFNQDHGATALKDYSNHTRAARQQLIAACRQEGLNLVSESFGNAQMNLTQIIDGFTGIEHTMGQTPLYEDVIRFFGATEIGMTPTLIVVYNGTSGENYFYQRERIWEDEKLLRFYSARQLMKHRRPTHYFDDDFYHMDMARELLKLHDAGVLLQMGAHGQKMGLGAHWEMEMFVHGGFSPYQALKIATINGFKHHGLDHELGSLEEGKLADLVIVSSNPLEDIRNSRDIKYVMKNGVLYSGTDASQVYPGKEAYKPMYFMFNEGNY